MKNPLFLCSLLAISFNTTGLLAEEVPLDLDRPNWQTLTYKGIPANTTQQAADSIQIDVDASASPLIYVFDQPQTFKTIRVNGELIGDLPGIPSGVQQGNPGADDFAFRIGLVISGSKTLNFARKLIAANWITSLYDLAPEGEGIDHVHFLNLANPGTIDWEQRDHPSSKGLFKETIVSTIQSNRSFELDYALDQPARALALWISSDGDDTASSYRIKLNNISYH